MTGHKRNMGKRWHQAVRNRTHGVALRFEQLEQRCCLSTLAGIESPVNTSAGAEGEDTTAPQVLIAFPSNGSTISIGHSLLVQIEASDDETLDRVEVECDIDGNGAIEPQEIITAPQVGAFYEAQFPSLAGAMTPRAVTARAYDLAGNSASTSMELQIEQEEGSYRNPLNQYDVDGNGRVNARDVGVLLSYLFRSGRGVPSGPRPPYPDVAAPDNVVNVRDVFVLISHLVTRGAGNANGEQAEGELVGASVTAETNRPIAGAQAGISELHADNAAAVTSLGSTPTAPSEGLQFAAHDLVFAARTVDSDLDDLFDTPFGPLLVRHTR